MTVFTDYEIPRGHPDICRGFKQKILNMTFMTSRLLRIPCMVIVASAWLASCEKVAQLSDAARVEEFSILTADPDRVIFDQPVIKGEVIELPLVYGKYLFPIPSCKALSGFRPSILQSTSFIPPSAESKFVCMERAFFPPAASITAGSFGTRVFSPLKITGLF